MPQLKHILKEDNGKCSLCSEEELREVFTAEGMNEEVSDRVCRESGGVRRHLEKVKRGRDVAVLVARLTVAERGMVVRGPPNHPGKDGIKRAMIKCFGGDAEEFYVLLVELAVMFGILADVMSEELMYLIAKPHGGHRPITC